MSKEIAQTVGGKRIAWLIAIVAAFAGPAAAGEVAIHLEGGWMDLTNASQSAQAVFDGASGGFAFGAGVRMSLTRSIYVGLGGRCSILIRPPYRGSDQYRIPATARREGGDWGLPLWSRLARRFPEVGVLGVVVPGRCRSSCFGS